MGQPNSRQKNRRDKEQITQKSHFALRRCFPSLETILGLIYISFSVFGAFEKFVDSQLRSTKPATRKKNINLKFSTAHIASNEVSVKCKNPYDGSVVLVLDYGIKSIINGRLLTVGPF